MAIQEQMHTVDTLWDLVCSPENDEKRFYLIDGELFCFPRPRYYLQGVLIASLSSYVYEHALQHDLGMALLGVGHHPPHDEHTLLGPAISFMSNARIPQPLPDEWIPQMPDLAVEIAAPGESLGHLRRKAAVYLDNGSALVWIILPSDKGIDVCRSASGSRLDIEFVGLTDKLFGEDVLPGFELEMTRLFRER